MTTLRLRLGERTEPVRLEKGEADLGGRRVGFEPGAGPGSVATLSVDGRVHRVAAAREGDRVYVWCDGAVFTFERVRSGRASAAADHAGELVAPMPGRVRRVHAAAGQAVERGAVLLALEAMKMEHTIRAPRDGVVERVLVTEGALVDAGQELVELR